MKPTIARSTAIGEEIGRDRGRDRAEERSGGGEIGEIGDSSRIKNLHPARPNKRRNRKCPNSVYADFARLKLILGRPVRAGTQTTSQPLLGRTTGKPVVRGLGAGRGARSWSHTIVHSSRTQPDPVRHHRSQLGRDRLDKPVILSPSLPDPGPSAVSRGKKNTPKRSPRNSAKRIIRNEAKTILSTNPASNHFCETNPI